jgi:hypothetical protein
MELHSPLSKRHVAGHHRESRRGQSTSQGIDVYVLDTYVPDYWLHKLLGLALNVSQKRKYLRIPHGSFTASGGLINLQLEDIFIEYTQSVLP